MQIQVHAGNHVSGDARLGEYADAVIRGAVERFSDSITRIDAHFADENSEKASPNDKRCTLEAHLSGRSPVAVTVLAATAGEALNGAAGKLERMLDGIQDRRNDKHPG
jgi:ribosome-associated translation inhibitor RaiA